MLLVPMEEGKDESEMSYQWEARERHVWLFHTENEQELGTFQQIGVV